MAENLTPKKYIDDSNMKQILTAIKDKTPIGGEHVTTDDKTLWNTVEDKVDKTSIVTALDDTVTDAQVASAKAVYDTTSKFLKTYTSIEQLGLTNGSETIEDIVNNMENFTRLVTTVMEKSNTSIYPYEYGILIVEKINIYRTHLKFFRDIIPDVYVSTYHGMAGFSGWKRLCATSVADVGWTVVTTTNPKISGGYIKYRVKNGICFVSVGGVESSATRGQTISNSLPKADSTNMYGGALTGSGDGENNGYMFISNGSTLIMNIKNTNTALYGSFSYPVAES